MAFSSPSCGFAAFRDRRRMLAVLLALLLFLTPPARAQENAKPVSADLFGLWYTKNHEAGIELYNCDGLLCGRAHYLPIDADVYDRQNPDPVYRGNPVCGLTLLSGFRPDGRGNYIDGHVYDPGSGSTYSAQLRLMGADSLEIHGYVLLPALGASQIWTRAAAMPTCTPPVAAVPVAPSGAAPRVTP